MGAPARSTTTARARRLFRRRDAADRSTWRSRSVGWERSRCSAWCSAPSSTSARTWSRPAPSTPTTPRPRAGQLSVYLSERAPERGRGPLGRRLPTGARTDVGVTRHGCSPSWGRARRRRPWSRSTGRWSTTSGRPRSTGSSSTPLSVSRPTPRRSRPAPSRTSATAWGQRCRWPACAGRRPGGSRR